MTTATWRFVVPNPGVDCWTAWTGGGLALLLIPVHAGEAYGYASSSKGGAAGADPAWLAQAFARFPTPARRAVEAALERGRAPYHSPVEEIRIDTWHRAQLSWSATPPTPPVRSGHRAPPPRWRMRRCWPRCSAAARTGQRPCPPGNCADAHASTMYRRRRTGCRTWPGFPAVYLTTWLPSLAPAPTGRLRSAARPALNQIAIGPLVSGALCRRTAARLPAGIRRR